MHAYAVLQTFTSRVSVGNLHFTTRSVWGRSPRHSLFSQQTLYPGQLALTCDLNNVASRFRGESLLCSPRTRRLSVGIVKAKTTERFVYIVHAVQTTPSRQPGGKRGSLTPDWVVATSWSRRTG